LDIAGTWSDTPPVCYENGGSVIMISTSIDGKVPPDNEANESLILLHTFSL